MSRQLWGKLTESEKHNETEKCISVSIKRSKLESENISFKKPRKKNISVKIKNPFVTQTIEVMKQTEMLQSLIDTYSTKSGSSNYLLNPCQMIPEVDFPPENAADFVSDEKFCKPIWFVPPLDTRFSRGEPQHYSKINSYICKSSLKKAACGQLRVVGFTDVAESALLLFGDAIEEFIRNFMLQIRQVHLNSKHELEPTINVKTLEKAYHSMTNVSLIQIHNYWRTLLSRNYSEIVEYKSVFQEYDKLMKESQNMQKEGFQENDFLNILEMPTSNKETVSANQIPDVNSIANPLLNIFETNSTIQSNN